MITHQEFASEIGKHLPDIPPEKVILCTLNHLVIPYPPLTAIKEPMYSFTHKSPSGMIRIAYGFDYWRDCQSQGFPLYRLIWAYSICDTTGAEVTLGEAMAAWQRNWDDSFESTEEET